MIIYTHYNLDLDAASSTALAIILARKENKSFNVAFVSADITKKELLARPDYEEDYLILDVDCEGLGLKGRKITDPDDPDRKLVYPAFSSILCTAPEEMQIAYAKLANYITYFDSSSRAKTTDCDLQEVFWAIKNAHYNLDDRVLDAWIPIIEGMYENYKSYIRARLQADKAVKYTNSIRILKGNTEPQTAKILLHKRGVQFVIYKNKNNLGVLIHEEVPMKTVNALAAELPGWFKHPSGFLICWGSSKAYKKEPPDISAEDLAKLIDEIVMY